MLKLFFKSTLYETIATGRFKQTSLTCGMKDAATVTLTKFSLDKEDYPGPTVRPWIILLSDFKNNTKFTKWTSFSRS